MVELDGVIVFTMVSLTVVGVGGDGGGDGLVLDLGASIRPAEIRGSEVMIAKKDM